MNQHAFQGWLLVELVPVAVFYFVSLVKMVFK